MGLNLQRGGDFDSDGQGDDERVFGHRVKIQESLTMAIGFGYSC